MFPLGLDDRLHWYNEALFGARAGNDLLRQATRLCLERVYQDWGDPGSIRAAIARNESAVRRISQFHFDPGFRPLYNFKTCDIMFDRTLPVERFLSNRDLKALKLYNTYFFALTHGKHGYRRVPRLGFSLGQDIPAPDA